MNEIASFYTQQPRIPDHTIRLAEEIAFLEARLIAIGHTGDCAYEKSLARSYVSMLHDRRRQLDELRGSSL